MIRIGPKILAEARQVLEGSVAAVQHVQMGVVLTADGLCLIAAAADLQEQEKLAAMGSAVSAIGAAVAREVQAGKCNRVTIEGTNTKILVVSLLDAPRLLLILVADHEIQTGRLIHVARSCSKAVNNVFERHRGNV